ncbi:MAG: tetratricopeptide repeat protein [Candidatus Lokiarchaeota archaeon]|nr:tetratricopeptide repeat protein [Candidatus Lokiarchaeota archaeon]
MNDQKVKEKPKELILAKRLIDECKLDEADQLIKNFEEKGGHTLHDIVLCHLLKCELLYWQGLYKDVVKLAEKTYKESLELGKNLLSVDILLIMANALVWLAQLDKLHDVIKQGEELLKILTQEFPADYKQREAYIAFLKGWFFLSKGDADLALKQFELSLSLREELGAKPEITFSLVGIAWVFMFLNVNFDRALKFLERGMTIAEESGNKWCIGYVLNGMGFLHGSKGELDRSIMLHERSLTIFNDLNNKYMVAWILNLLGGRYNMRGELDRSIRFYEQSMALYKELNNKARMAGVFNNLSYGYKMRGELDRALECIEQALALHQEMGNSRYIAGLHDFLIQILIDRGDLERARISLRDFEQLNNQLKDKQINLIYLFDKALLLKTSHRARNRAKAEEILEQLLEEEDLAYEIKIGALLNLCELLLTELRITNDLEVLDELNQFIVRLLDIAEKSHSYSILCESLLIQAKLALISLNLEKAQKLLTQGQKIAEKYGFSPLARKISNEHDKLLKQLSMWENLKESEASLNERIELARLNEQMENMIRKRAIEVPELSDEEPVFILIVSEGGRPIFSQSFIEDQSFEDHLFGGFFTAINSFISEKFSEGLDRATFGEHTLLMNSVSPFLMCYVFKGQSYSAQIRIRYFIDKIKHDEPVWQTFKKFHQVNKEVQLKDIPSLEPLINEIFIRKTIHLNGLV